MSAPAGILLSGIPGELVPWKPLPNLGEALDLLSADAAGNALTVRCLSGSGRGLTLICHHAASFRLRSLECDESLAVMVDNELLPYGRTWEILDALPADEKSAVSGVRRFVLLTMSTWVEVSAADAVHVSWDDNFFGDAV